MALAVLAGPAAPPALAAAVPKLPVPECDLWSGGGQIGLRCRPPYNPAGQSLTHVQVDVSQAGGLVSSRVLPVPVSTYALIDGVTNGVPYDVTVRYGSFDRVSVPLERRLNPRPYPTLVVGNAKEEAGARLPFAVILDAPSTVATTVQIAKDPETAALLGAGPTSVTVPAGELVASGSYEVVPNGQRNTSYLMAYLGWSVTSEPPKRGDYVGGYLHGDAQADVPTATLTGPATVGEGAHGVEYTVTLDRPAAVDIPLHVTGGEQGRESDGYDVTIPAGATSAIVPVDFGAQDQAAGGDRLFPLVLDSVGDPVRVDIAPEPLTVRLVDDDAHGPALTLDGDLQPGGAQPTGVAVSSFVQWQNRGDRIATDARLDLSISDSSPQVTLTSPTGVDCGVTATDGGKGRAISCALGDVVPGGSGGLMVTWVPTVVPAADAVLTARMDSAGSGPRPADLSATVPVSGPSCTVVGPLGSALLRGTAADDVLCGPLSGIPTNDKVQPGAGDDVIRASGKYDYSSSPNAVEMAASGDDMVVKGWGTDVIETSLPGLTGRVLGSRFADQFEVGLLDADGGPGDDTFWWRPTWNVRQPVVVGGSGVDTLRFAPGSTVVKNLAQAAWFKGIEQVRGTGRSDVLTVGGGVTLLDGAGGPDVLVATDGVAGDVTVVGGDGNDTCTVDAGDTVTGCETVTSVPLP